MAVQQFLLTVNYDAVNYHEIGKLIVVFNMVYNNEITIRLLIILWTVDMIVQHVWPYDDSVVFASEPKTTSQ